MRLTEELLQEIGLTPSSVPSPDAIAAAQFEQQSIAKFRSHDGPTKELRQQHVGLLREAIIYGVLAVITTPLDHSECTSRKTKLRNNIVVSILLFLATGRFRQPVLVGAKRIFQLLQDSEIGFDIENDEDHCTLINVAMYMGNDYVTEELLERGVNINAKDFKGMTALHYAAIYGRWTMIQPLKIKGADFEAKVEPMPPTPCGLSALHIAAKNGDTGTVRELLRLGANIDEEDQWQAQTALCIAAEWGREDVVRLLTDNGSAVDGSSKCDASPLICACAAGHEAVVCLLLKKGADISRSVSAVEPALHTAAFHGKEAIVRLLLDHNFDPRLRGKSGRTAVWFAFKGGHQEIAWLLVERGGDSRDRPDITIDSYERLCNTAGGRLLEHVERAQQMMFHISAIQSWLKNLRFVVLVEGQDEYDLELIEVGTGDDKESNQPYIAVSYCWGNEADQNGAPLRIQIPSKQQPGAKEIRNVRASSNILRRSLAFAAAKGIKRVWIDQECIHQDDEKDKVTAIQCMHLVYQQATITLILLGEHVRTLEDVRAISDLKRQGEDLRDRIMRDRWFSRAWPTQEYVSSTMERLSYLIGWKDDLDISGDAWELEATSFNARAIIPNSMVVLEGEDLFNKAPLQTVRRAWELDVDFIRSLSFKDAAYSRVMQSMVASSEWTPKEKAYRLLNQDVESEGWWKGNGMSITSSATSQRRQTGDASVAPAAFDKLRMTMPQAYNTLLGKDCTFNSDRIAILSNLAQYPYRIKPDQAVQESLSFTACVIATALYNGDLSFLFIRNSIRAMFSKTLPLTNLLSWLPFASAPIHNVLEPTNMPPNMAVDKPSGDRCLVIDGKALIKGLFWIIEPFHGFDSLQESFRKLRPANKGKESKHGHLLVRQVINRCLELGRRDILELVVTAALPRQLICPAEIITLMDNLQETFMKKCSGSSTDTTEVEIATASSELIEVNEILSGEPSTNDLITWIYDAISNGRPLALGKCNIGREDRENEPLVSIFTLDTTKHHTVFTPLSELDYEYNEMNVWAHLFAQQSFWCVTSCDEKVVTEATMQKARKKLGGLGEEAQSISDQSFKIEPIYGGLLNDNAVAIWSPRLSRVGMHAPSDADRESWRRIPLGREVFWRRS